MLRVPKRKRPCKPTPYVEPWLLEWWEVTPEVYAECSSEQHNPVRGLWALLLCLLGVWPPTIRKLDRTKMALYKPEHSVVSRGLPPVPPWLHSPAVYGENVTCEVDFCRRLPVGSVGVRGPVADPARGGVVVMPKIMVRRLR